VILALPVFGAAAGAIVGSFLATLCVRWPRGEQVVAGRSSCDSCGRALRAPELIPIGSALAAHGQCRSCGARIPPLHLQMEIAAAALAALALVLQPNAGGIALALFWLLLLAPAVLDARHFWLPDRLILVLALGGLVLGGFVSGEAIQHRLIGGIAGFAALWLLAHAYRRFRGRDGLGLGDSKLLGAIGLWTGWMALPPILLLASAIGLAVALAQGRSRLEQMPFGTLLIVATIVSTALNGTQLF
jgi:leader peptidase (prepilin peptidase) / N-methyltransferase